jgi:2-keto-3-deoxy-L-rhamnonate aldolase RhmA
VTDKSKVPNFLQGNGAKLIAKLDRGEPIIGVLLMSPSPDLVEILAYVGYDYIIVDQMFTAVDWSHLASIVRAARGSDMAVLARIENDPWHGGDDLGASARAARAMGVGCDGVKVNVFGPDQARRVMKGAAGWHRNMNITPFDTDTFAEHTSSSERSALVIPGVESELGLATTPEMLEIEDLRIFSIALTDTSRMLGVPMQYEHPKVWGFVDQTYEIAGPKGIDLCCGTGYAFREPQDIADRVKRLHDHGVRMIFLQTAEFLIQILNQSLLGRVRSKLGY